MDVVVNSDCRMTLTTQSLIQGKSHYYLNMFQCLGYPDNAPPIADWLRLYHGLEGQWLVVTPVYWHATHNDAMLMACDQHLNCTDEEARALFDVFTLFATSQGMRTYFHDSFTWLLQCDGQPLITASPPHALLHHSIFPHLKSLDSTFFWQRFLTEVQMLLGSRSGGKTSINGVWIWGGGALGSPSNRTILVHTQRQYDMAKLLSNRVSYFLDPLKITDVFRDQEICISSDCKKQSHKAAAKIDKNVLFLYDSIESDEMALLSNRFKESNVNWFWNNVAYHTLRPSWFSRMISFILKKVS